MADVWTLANPVSMPNGISYGNMFSDDGVYLAVGGNYTNGCIVYKRNGDVFTKLTTPATGWVLGRCVAFSPGGNYLAVTYVSDKLVRIFKRNGDTFTELPDPVNMPSSDGAGVTFSQDGALLAVCKSTTPRGICIFKREGDTFTLLSADITMIGNYGCWSIAFSPDGRYLAFNNIYDSRVQVYKRNGDAFAALTTLSHPDTAHDIAFSADSNYMVVGHQKTPYITIYKISAGDVFSKLPNPSTLPSENIGRIAYMANKYLAVTTRSGACTISIYTQDGDSFASVQQGLARPTGDIGDTGDLSFSPDGVYLAVTTWDSPYFALYKSDNPPYVPPSTGPKTIIERSTDQTNWSQIAEVEDSTGTYSDTSTTQGVAYYYRIKRIIGEAASPYTMLSAQRATAPKAIVNTLAPVPAVIAIRSASLTVPKAMVTADAKAPTVLTVISPPQISVSIIAGGYRIAW